METVLSPPLRATERAHYSAICADRLLLWLLATDITAIVVAMTHGLIDSGDFSSHTSSMYLGALSAAQMGVTAILAFRTFNLRRGCDGLRESLPRRYFVWALIGLGFAYLPLDEIFSLHGKLDRLVHLGFGITETALSDRIDAAIIAFYGCIGVAVLARYHQELRYFDIRRWLVGGFLFLGCSVVFDAVSDRPDVAFWLIGQATAAAWCNGIFAVIEALAQLVAVSFFLVALYCAGGKAKKERLDR